MLSKDEFKAKLKEAGFTQKQVAEALNHKPSWLSRLISGARDMNCEDLLKICAVTGIPPTELLGFKMPEQTPDLAEKKVSRELAALLTDEMVEEIVRVRKLKGTAKP